jgi:hypothetical protein
VGQKNRRSALGRATSRQREEKRRRTGGSGARRHHAHRHARLDAGAESAAPEHSVQAMPRSIDRLRLSRCSASLRQRAPGAILSSLPNHNAQITSLRPCFHGHREHARSTEDLEEEDQSQSFAEHTEAGSQQPAIARVAAGPRIGQRSVAQPADAHPARFSHHRVARCVPRPSVCT